MIIFIILYIAIVLWAILLHKREYKDLDLPYEFTAFDLLTMLIIGWIVFPMLAISNCLENIIIFKDKK